MITRRSLLKSASALCLALASGCASTHPKSFPVTVSNSTQRRGHALFNYFSRPAKQIHTDVAIAGSGIAGLTCAWKLNKCGLTDFQIFDLEEQAGGNSRAVHYKPSRAPLAAHYLPTPTREATATMELLEDLGLITGWDANGDPIYDEAQLCHAPQERLYMYGDWTEGLFPTVGAQKQDIAQADAFYAQVHRYQGMRDSQGRRPFTIPIANSGHQADELDCISMAEYLDRRGWTSPRLRWHIEYGCRDDYGTSLSETSAWAGFHYFCARNPDKPGPSNALFTWPEGNNWFVTQLQKELGNRFTSNAVVFRINPGNSSVELDYSDAVTHETTRVYAKHVVCCFPTFLRPMLISGQPKRREFTYCPWATANLVLKHLPSCSMQAPICWDNVIYESPSLGYVVATHQSLSAYTGGPTVITWYRPYTESADVRKLRWKLLHHSAQGFAEDIVNDLAIPHPDLEPLIERIDVTLLGHAMIRPIPNIMFGSSRLQAAQSSGRLHFAHSDLSGLSIFEEAQYHGVRAAEEILREVRIKHTSSLKPV